jgi:PAS domain S-box-containing protein
MAKPKILIVEDQKIISTNIKLLLKYNQYNISGVVETADDAFRSIKETIPDLIIMDITLPGDMDGIDIANRIYQRWDIPVIFLTAHKDEKTRKRAQVFNAYGYINKDVQINMVLPVTVEFALYRHKVEKERKMTETIIRESEEKFSTIVNTVRDGIFFLDENGIVNFWNQAAENILGYTKKDVLGSRLFNLIATEENRELLKDGLSNLVRRDKNQLIGRLSEINVKKKNGKIISLELSLSMIAIKEQLFACGIVRDISRRKSAEQGNRIMIEELKSSREIVDRHSNELIQLNSMLIESEKTLRKSNLKKDKFFSIIANDLQEPFQVFLDYSAVLSKEIDTLSIDEISEYAFNMHSNAQKLFKLLENLMHWSKLQQGSFEVEPEILNLNRIADNCLGYYSDEIHQKSIDVKFNVDPKLKIFVDVKMIKYIVRNLISNSVKFNNEYGKISISADYYDDETIRLSVEDLGKGMSEEISENIFEISQKRSKSSDDESTGLGLIISHEFAKLNNSKILVFSQENLGTKFKLLMPSGKSDVEQ